MRKSRSFLNFDNFLDAAPTTTETEQSSQTPSNSTSQKPKEEEKKMSKPADRSYLHSKQVLTDSFKLVKAVGSSTAVVAIQNGNQLHLSNLGDSGF